MPPNTAPSEATNLLHCDDRLALNTDPWCEDFFHLVRLLPIKDYERVSGVDAHRTFLEKMRSAGTDRRYAAQASQQHLANALRCGLLAAMPPSKGGIIASVVDAAERFAERLWLDYRHDFIRRCDRTSAPLCCRDIELALVIRYQQCWKAAGYWRGDLLQSLSLAPGEELTLEFFHWDRRKIERERSTEASVERSETGSITARSSSEVVTSVAFRAQAGAEGKIGGSVPLEETGSPIDAEGEVGANFQTEFSGSITSTQNRLTEATRTATNTLRNTRKTRIVETAEVGSESRSTRRIRNENKCHTVNYDYFEVLEQYEVTTGAVDASFVALVPIPEIDAGGIDAAWLLCHEHPLRAHLLHRLYENGFDAARLLRTSEILRQRLQPTPPAPPASPPDDPSGTGSAPATPADPIGDQLRVYLDAIVEAKSRLASASASADDYLNLFNWNLTTQKAAFRRVSKVATREFVLAVYPGLFDRIDELAAHRDAPGPELASHLTIFKTQVLSTGLIGLVNQPIKLEAFPLFIFDFNDEGLIGAMDAAFIGLDGLGPALTVQNSSSTVLPPAPDAVTPDGPAPSAPALAPADQMLDERMGLEALAEAEAELERLICHIRENINYYRAVLFSVRGPAAIEEVLQACPHLAQLVDRRILGVQSGFAIFPLRPTIQERMKRQALMEAIEVSSKRDSRSMTVVLPTAGTVLEARLGQCSACEPFIRDHRVQDLEHRRHEVALAKANADQAAQTARRYRLRLDATPPQLDDPETDDPPLVRVQLESVSSDGTGATEGGP